MGTHTRQSIPVMSRTDRYLHLDVFTREKFGGNQLAVFLDGRGLSAATMQAIAKEMNFSETTFMLPAERPDTDVRMRIFTPGRGDADGGPSDDRQRVRAGARRRDRPRAGDRIVFGLGIGPTPVSLELARAPTLSFAWMTQPMPAFGDVVGDRGARRPRSALRPRRVTAHGAAGAGRVVRRAVPVRPARDAPRRSTTPCSIAGGSRRCARAASVDAHAVFLFSPEPGDDKADGVQPHVRAGPRRRRRPGDGKRQRAAGLLSRAAPRRAAREGRADAEPAGREDGTPELDAHLDRRRRTAASRASSVGGEAVLVGEGELFL